MKWFREFLGIATLVVGLAFLQRWVPVPLGVGDGNFNFDPWNGDALFTKWILAWASERWGASVWIGWQALTQSLFAVFVYLALRKNVVPLSERVGLATAVTWIRAMVWAGAPTSLIAPDLAVLAVLVLSGFERVRKRPKIYWIAVGALWSGFFSLPLLGFLIAASRPVHLKGRWMRVGCFALGTCLNPIGLWTLVSGWLMLFSPHAPGLLRGWMRIEGSEVSIDLSAVRVLAAMALALMFRPLGEERAERRALALALIGIAIAVQPLMVLVAPAVLWSVLPDLTRRRGIVFSAVCLLWCTYAVATARSAQAPLAKDMLRTTRSVTP